MRIVSDDVENERLMQKLKARGVVAEADSPPPTPENRARYLCWVMNDWTKTLRAMKPTPENDFPFAHDGMLAVDVRKQTMFSMIDTAAMFKAMVDNPEKVPTDNTGAQWIEFVREHCNWPGADRVSVPVLLKRIEHRVLDPKKSDFPPLTHPDVRRLVDHLQSINDRFADIGRDVRSSEIDPMLDELRRFMTIAPIGRLVENTTLVKVLYALRNSRIHLMRNLGDAVEVWSQVADEPTYQGQQASRNYVLSPTELHLLFPEAFVERLLRAGIESLRDFLVAKEVDPYNSLRDTSAWELRDFTPLKSWSTP